jgi:NAD+ kinase
MSAVAFLLKREQPDAVDLCRRLAESLRDRGTGETALVISDQVNPPPGLATVTEAQLPRDLRLLVVLGGDGTLLYGASLIRDTNTPILGVNLGHLGFLTACSPAQAVDGLNAALSGKLLLEERQSLCCKVHRPPEVRPGCEDRVEVIVEREAVNEIVLSQPQQARLFELDAYLDGEHVTTYKADGLIVSTPTGSTAYNLAAGGPILLPQMKALVITPICPHTLTARPLVAPLSSCIEVRQGRNADKVMLTVDGQWNIHLGPADRVQLTCAKSPFRIFKAPNRSFFDLLRVKLHWGVRE